jgi:hypothetical protein
MEADSTKGTLQYGLCDEVKEMLLKLLQLSREQQFCYTCPPV